MTSPQHVVSASPRSPQRNEPAPAPPDTSGSPHPDAAPDHCQSGRHQAQPDAIERVLAGRGVPDHPADSSPAGAAGGAVPDTPVGPVASDAGVGVRATARLCAAPDGHGGTRLPLLSGAGPLALRRTRGRGPVARVTLVGAMSAPLNGDQLALEAQVQDGAWLHFDGTAATLALPGRTTAPAQYATHLTVGAHADVHWLPEPLISAAGSCLQQTLHVELAGTARLVLRDEQVLGRTGEPPGALTTRLTVHRDGRPLLDQQLDYGPHAPGWDGPAGLAGHRAVGQLLVVDPAFAQHPPHPRLLGPTAAVTPLAGPAVLVTAVAADARRLRQLLDDGNPQACGGRWQTAPDDACVPAGPADPRTNTA